MNFVAKMRDDDKIQDQVLNAIAGKDEDTAAQAFVALGKAQGFTFSAEDALVVYHRAQALEQQRAASGEMSGADLNQVSGGGNLKREGMPPARGGIVAPPSSGPATGGGVAAPSVPKPGIPVIPDFSGLTRSISSY